VRFWGEGPETQDALTTLYEVLTRLSRLIAPFVPFTAEALHRALTVDVGVAAEPSVHLESWPTPDDALRDDALAAEMALVRDVVSLGLAARSASRMKVRQPLRDVTVVLADPSGQATLERHDALMRDELNVREVRFSAQATEFVEYRIKPDFKKLGPKLGKGVKEAATLLEAMNGGELKAALDAGGVVLNLSSGEVTLTSDEVVVTVLKKEGFEAAANAAAVVALSTELDDDLRSEGLVRELTSRVQTMRKEQELGYTDRIRVTLELPEVLSAAVGRFGDYLARETLAVDVQIGAAGGPLLDVDGHDVRIGIERV
jgi:isoleucyl-tRNA synthetase